MSEDELPRIHAPSQETGDVPTVPRGGGAPITEDEELQEEHVAPESNVRVHHTDAARAAEEGMSPYGGLDPQRPNRSTLDNSPDNADDDVVDNRY